LAKRTSEHSGIRGGPRWLSSSRTLDRWFSGKPPRHPSLRGGILTFQGMQWHRSALTSSLRAAMVASLRSCSIRMRCTAESCCRSNPSPSSPALEAPPPPPPVYDVEVDRRTSKSTSTPTPTPPNPAPPRDALGCRPCSSSPEARLGEGERYPWCCCCCRSWCCCCCCCCRRRRRRGGKGDRGVGRDGLEVVAETECFRLREECSRSLDWVADSSDRDTHGNCGQELWACAGEGSVVSRRSLLLVRYGKVASRLGRTTYGRHKT